MMLNKTEECRIEVSLSLMFSEAAERSPPVTAIMTEPGMNFLHLLHH